MAGLTGEQVVVDVVAASERLVPSTQPTTEPGERLEVAPDAPREIAGLADDQPPQHCALGHETPAGFRFCPTCGLSMDARPFVPGEPQRPKPEAELTPEETTERDRQHAEALAVLRKFEAEPPQYQPDTGRGVLIHFI